MNDIDMCMGILELGQGFMYFVGYDGGKGQQRRRQSTTSYRVEMGATHTPYIAGQGHLSVWAVSVDSIPGVRRWGTTARVFFVRPRMNGFNRDTTET